MKKMIFVVTALLLAAPALAGVTISCAQEGTDPNVIISYTATEDGNLPRGLGLEVTADSGATIDSVVSASADYWVYPGSIVIDPCTGTMTDQGTPAASGLGTSSVILEMGSLHYPTGPSDTNSPPLADALITLALTLSGDCNVAIAGNSERGNVVNYAAEEITTVSGDLVYTGCLIVEDVICWTGDAASRTEWETVGSPECWCAGGDPAANPRQCHGDADGLSQGRSNYWVSTDDLAILKAAWNIPNGPTTQPGICADFDRQGQGRSNYRVSTDDLAILKSNWNIANGPAPDCQDVVGSQEP